MKACIILDANALISTKNLLQMGPKYQLFTCRGVMDEIKDAHTQQFLKQFPFDLIVQDCDSSALQAITDFATKTGDIASLSKVDLQLLALAYTHHAPHTVFRTQPARQVQFTSQVINQTKEEQQQQQEQHQEELIVQEQEQGWNYVAAKEVVKQDQQEQDEGQWVTLQTMEHEWSANATIDKPVYIMTSDYAMQNVAMQIGMNILSNEGLYIGSLRRFIYQCYVCWKRFPIQNDKIVECKGCGYNSLSKIAYTLDEKGQITLHRKRGWKPNQKVREWKENKFQMQQKCKKHQKPKRTKKQSIFQ